MVGRPADYALALIAGFLAMVSLALMLSLVLDLSWTCDPDVSHCDHPPQGASFPFLSLYLGAFVTVTALAARWLSHR